jgi:hypothetical protein
MTPIVSHIWCVRPQLPEAFKRYGAYPNGSLEKFRIFMGVHITDPVLHVCAGHVRHYKYANRAVGPNDKTLDLDPSVKPDFLQDARDPWPHGFKAVIADPDYSEADASKRPMGSSTLPTPRQLMARAYEALEPGRRFGILHVKTLTVPTDKVTKKPLWLFLAKMNVGMGGENRERVYSVFERTA